MRLSTVLILVLLAILAAAAYSWTAQNKATVPSGPEPSPEPTILQREIQTQYGDLLLKYQNGVATLTGSLMRSTPCIEWSSSVSATKDVPPSQVDFRLIRKSTADICIQVLGEPHQVSLQSPAGPNTNYKVLINETLVFSGKLK